MSVGSNVTFAVILKMSLKIIRPESSLTLTAENFLAYSTQDFRQRCEIGLSDVPKDAENAILKQ